MFLQPMLLREELEQFPYSYCRMEGQDAQMKKWCSVLCGLGLTLEMPLELEDPMLQNILVEVRASNGFAGWKCPESIAIYQAIAVEVQGPLNWNNLSEQTKRSMNDYLQICRDRGVVGAELLIQMDETTTTTDPVTGARYVEMSRKNADAQDIARADAINKISNPEVKEELLRGNMTRRMMRMRGEGFTLRMCSGCEATALSKLKKCSRCLVREYCSVQCQKEHWPQGHKKECSHFVEITKIRISEELASNLQVYNATMSRNA